MLLTGFAWPRELISCWRSGHQVVDGLLGTVRHLSDLSHLYPMPPRSGGHSSNTCYYCDLCGQRAPEIGKSW